ncbi:MAG: hypothetical protein AB9921_07740 [Erysipelotrichaceae bacterium]
MFKKLMIVFTLFLVILSGCSKTAKQDPDDEPVPTGIFPQVTLKLELTNPEENDDRYLVYLMVPGTKTEEPGKAQQGNYYGPFETDADLSVTIDFEFNWDMDYYVSTAIEAGHKKLQVYVTTMEDIYLRNPLNEETFIDLVENKDEATKADYGYGSLVEKKTVEITDAYPEGVLSLTFPDATFVIKLNVPEGTTKSYEVSIHRPNSTGDGVSMVRIGRIDRAFQYYDTPFFKEDKLETWSGFIVINDFDTGANIEYEGYPRYVEFDADGKCKDGDIVIINMP